MKIDITKAASFVKAGAIEALEPQVKAAQEALEQGTCAGNDFLGWMHLPSSITPEFIAELNATATSTCLSWMPSTISCTSASVRRLKSSY